MAIFISCTLSNFSICQADKHLKPDIICEWLRRARRCLREWPKPRGDWFACLQRLPMLVCAQTVAAKLAYRCWKLPVCYPCLSCYLVNAKWVWTVVSQDLRSPAKYYYNSDWEMPMGTAVRIDQLLRRVCSPAQVFCSLAKIQFTVKISQQNLSSLSCSNDVFPQLHYFCSYHPFKKHSSTAITFVVL